MTDTQIPSVTIGVEWVTVAEDGKPAVCHDKGIKRSKNLAKLLKGPQIYRWVLRDSGGKELASYIGETGNFRSRLAGYQNGHKKPNDTINFLRNHFHVTCSEGGRVELQFLHFQPFLLNGVLIESTKLTSPEIRKFLENVAIITAKGSGLRLLNRDKDVNVKVLERAIRSLPPEEQRPFVEKLLREAEAKKSPSELKH